jgi:phage terminase large subunit GpA-like protein
MSKNKRIHAPLPAWLHPDTARQVLSLGKQDWGFAMGKGERAVFRRRRQMRVSVWAEGHRVVHNSSLPGKWKNAANPCLAGIMDASFHPSVQTVVMMKAPQIGGTEAVHNCVGYAIDRAPGPALYVYPDELTARENAVDRVIPMLKASARLSEYLTGAADDLSSMRINLRHMPLHMAWSGSPARLGNKPIRYLIMDELDKYQSSKREASSEDLAEKRVTTWRRKARIWKLSTPTLKDVGIHAAWKAAEARYRYHVVCPYCGVELLMEFDRIKWPAAVNDPVKLESGSLAWYECQHCDAQWSDADRDMALRRGVWREGVTGTELEEHLRDASPMVIAFHIPAWISPFSSLSKVASKALAFQQGKDESIAKDLQNNFKGEPWEERHSVRAEDSILALKDDRPRGLVPGGGQVAALVATVDTQDNGFVYEIRAQGWGIAEETWSVREGFLPVDWEVKTRPQGMECPWRYHPAFDSLRRVLWEEAYSDEDGVIYPVQLTIIDAMGHYTTEVYDFCSAHRGLILPYQGVQRMNVKYAYTPILRYPGTNKPFPGGLKLLRGHTTFWKDKLSTRLRVAPTDPGAWHYHGEISDDWAKGMCAEYKDEKTGYWVCPKGKANHAWDVAHYALIAADILGIKMWESEPAPLPAAPPTPSVNPYTGGRQMFGRSA